MVFNKRVIGVLMVLLLLTTLLSGCMATDYSKGQEIIEAEALVSILKDPQVVVVDARTAEEYAKGHLLGAISLPPSLLTISEPVEGMIAPKAAVESVLSEKGIANTSKVYIYDNKGGIFAARLWWVLKVYGHENVFVINDGEDAIVASGMELSAEGTTLPVTTYQASEPNAAICATIEDVKAAIDGTKPAKILDVRSQAEFDEGAIPTAILYPHTKNLFEDGTFRPTGHIQLNYKELGLNPSDAIIVYCKTSVRATQTALLLKEAGYTNVKVYDGAWLEWSSLEAPQAPADQEVVPTELDAS
jgi:thiosulfate/3-mercaptopyruvate sulfurtransferase